VTENSNRKNLRVIIFDKMQMFKYKVRVTQIGGRAAATTAHLLPLSRPLSSSRDDN